MLRNSPVNTHTTVLYNHGHAGMSFSPYIIKGSSAFAVLNNDIERIHTSTLNINYPNDSSSTSSNKRGNCFSQL